MALTDQPAGPNAYVIAGPNGAGKTTFAREFLPYYAECKNFINADLIAQGLSPFSPETAAFRAGRLVLSEIASMAERRLDFGFETTLAGRSHMGLIRRLKERGYQIHLFYLWLPNVELALSRIQQRVLRGGHSVAEIDVRRRFERSIRNFLMHYAPLATSWMLFDNSDQRPSLIASTRTGTLVIMQEERYRELIQRMDKDHQLSDEILNLPLHERAEIALREAVRKVIEKSARDHQPVYIWRDGKVVAVPAEELLKQQ